MGKERPKSRLDKGGARAEFIGFGAVGDVAPAAAAAAEARAAASGPVWAPVYVGPDADLRLLFPRIGQKRDGTTKAKALRELAAYLADPDRPRRLRAAALPHWAWLYHHRLVFDAQAVVRAEALAVWRAAADELPRATMGLVRQHPELAGMLWAAQCDADAAVRDAYRRCIADLVASTLGSIDGDTDEDSPLWPWQPGLLEYVHRILSYGRPSAMHDALFARKPAAAGGSISGGSTSPQPAPKPALSEDDRDVLAERFERIVGGALGGMEVWVRENPDRMDQVAEPQVVWFQTLSSPMPSLRFRTYRLLCSCFMKGQEGLAPPDIATAMAEKVMPAEKDPNNTPLLLETILVILSKQPQHHGLFQRPLQKLLSRACHGARVAAWGPTVLPLLSLLPDRLPLLTALRQADIEPHGGGTMDAWQLRQVTVECAVFCLLRRRTDESAVDNGSTDDAIKVAQIWLSAFRTAMEETKSSLPPLTRKAYVTLIRELGKSFLLLDEASTQRPNCDFYFIKDWFWSEGLRLEPASDPEAVAELLLAIRSCRPVISKRIFFLDVFRDYFIQVLKKFRTNSGSVPTDSAFLFFLEIFRTFCASRILDEGELERFITNDLVRWTVVHTSLLSKQEQIPKFVDNDFELLALSFKAMGDKSKQLWPVVLKEILNAHCSLELFTTGLRAFLRYKDASIWIVGPDFDRFAQNVGVYGYNPIDECPGGEDSAASEQDFLRLCLGCFSTPMLVSDEVISSWINAGSFALEAPHQDTVGPRSKILIESLLPIVEKGSIFNDEETDRILLTAWYLGGDYFRNKTIRTLYKDTDICTRFIANTSSYLLFELDCLCEKKSVLKDVNLKEWSDRAFRLIMVCQGTPSHQATYTGNMAPSLKLIGLADMERWRQYPDVLFHCATSFFEHMEGYNDKMEIITRSSDDPITFVSTILLHLSEAGDDAYTGLVVKNGRDRAGSFLSQIGGDALSSDYLETLSLNLIEQAYSFQLPHDTELFRRSVANVSLVMHRLLKPIESSVEDDIDPTAIKEGMHLWHIADPERPDERTSVEVVKVRYDAENGYYFSVKSNSHERQTVIERLKLTPATQAPEETSLIRNRLRGSLLKLINHQLDSKPTEPMVGELINILCGVIGLDEARGIGSSHYDLFTKIFSVQEEVKGVLQQLDLVSCSGLMWTLALSLGFGLNVPTYRNVPMLLPSGLKPILSEILEFYGHEEMRSIPAVNEAALALLITMLTAISDGDDSIVALELVFRISSAICESVGQKTFSHQEVLVTRALYTAFKNNPQEIQSNVEIFELATEVVKKWLKKFATVWENDESEPAWLLYSDFSALVKLVRHDSAVEALFLAACDAEMAELLSHALFFEWKRHFSFVLLYLVGTRGDKLFADQALNPETARHLQQWTEGLDPEESEEIEEDVEMVLCWLPRRIAKELEFWGEQVYEETDVTTTIARLMLWLFVLRQYDVCSSKGFRVRPAFLSYLSQSGAVDAALNLALLNDDSLSGPDTMKKPSLLDVEVLLNDRSMFQLGKVASLVLFQTIELLPSLSRKWWEESCPKVYNNDVQSFVEKYVAPVILRREISRIRAATSVFGGMGIIASPVSREVKATYTQDDFTLSVLIFLPAAFPLRSADVDCSKTIGIPQDRLKRWSLQIRMMLNNQGGTLQDALMFWKDNVDKEFEGVEPCPVCYSVLHVKTHKIPRLKCKTCENRFHFDCLAQWFRSSGKNQCVLCQQPWQGTRV